TGRTGDRARPIAIQHSGVPLRLTSRLSCMCRCPNPGKRRSGKSNGLRARKSRSQPEDAPLFGFPLTEKFRVLSSEDFEADPVVCDKGVPSRVHPECILNAPTWPSQPPRVALKPIGIQGLGNGTRTRNC